jgi:hypothetical protein
MTSPHPERWCAIPLSNWARAYDKYTGRFVKALLPRTTFPHQTFVLPRGGIAVGLAKVEAWVERAGCWRSATSSPCPRPCSAMWGGTAR